MASGRGCLSASSSTRTGLPSSAAAPRPRIPRPRTCPLLFRGRPRHGGYYDVVIRRRSFSCGHGAPSSACSGLYIDVDAARSAVLLCRTQTNTHTTETEQTNMNKQPERHSGIAHQRRIKLASRKNSAHCACLFASWECQLTLDVIYFVSVDMGHARTRRTTRRRLLFVMGLFVCTNEAALTISPSQCDTEGQCNRAGRAGKQIITNRTPTTKTDRSQATND